LISGSMSCWVIRDEDKKDRAIITTIYFYSPLGDRDLCLYTAFAFSPVSDTLWNDAFDTLRKWAIRNDCKHVVSYTENKRMLRLAESYGCSVKTFISFDLNRR